MITNSRRDRDRLVAGVEEMAGKIINRFWDQIEFLSYALILADGYLSREELATLTDDVPRIDLDLLAKRSEGDGEVRYRYDGYLRPFR